jgi:hypothetical protein
MGWLAFDSVAAASRCLEVSLLDAYGKEKKDGCSGDRVLERTVDPPEVRA